MMCLCIEKGYEIVNFNETADTYIINTCTVTGEAERKSKQMVRKAIKKNHLAKVIVTGCSAQSCSEELRNISGITAILGNTEKKDVLKCLEKNEIKYPYIEINPIKDLKGYDTLSNTYIKKHIRSLIKIQDGCNNFCSYCKVPYVRGPERSRKPAEIIKEIQILEEKGIKEIVLLGINLGTYQHDFENKERKLPQLIQLIEKNCKHIRRIRLSSIEINHIGNDLIEMFHTSQKICQHLHIPLQSGDDKILKLMNRPYNTSFFKDTVDKVRSAVPGIAITTDIMVGFPGEDNFSMEKAYSFLKKVNFSKLHVFPYSERKECLSQMLPDKVDSLNKKERRNRLLDLSKELNSKYMTENLKNKKYIIIESVKRDLNEKTAFGITDNYIPVKVDDFRGEKGDMVKVKLIDIEKEHMLGKILQ